MNPQGQDYKQLLTEVIKKQIVILGPDITLSKARNVKGITVAQDGTVTNVEGEPQAVTQALIDQFVQLSGLIVKKTMEPLLSISQSQPTPTTPLSTPQPQAATVSPVSPTPPPAESAQAVINAAAAAPQPTIPAQPLTPPNAQAATAPAPAKNPLAA